MRVYGQKSLDHKLSGVPFSISSVDPMFCYCCSSPRLDPFIFHIVTRVENQPVNQLHIVTRVENQPVNQLLKKTTP